MKVKAAAVVFAAAGLVLIWSALRGVSITGTLRSMLSPPPGDAPANAAADDGTDAPTSWPRGTHPMTSEVYR